MGISGHRIFFTVESMIGRERVDPEHLAAIFYDPNRASLSQPHI